MNTCCAQEQLSGGDTGKRFPDAISMTLRGSMTASAMNGDEIKHPQVR